MPRVHGRLALGSAILAGLVIVTAEPATAAPPEWGEVKRLGSADSYPYKGPTIAAVGPKNVWAVDGDIHHWNGRRWKTVRPTGQGDTRFIGVVASSAHDVWFVTGIDPTYQDVEMVHWDGRRWKWSKRPRAVHLSVPASLIALPNGDLWRANYDGLARLRGGKWKITHADLWSRAIGGRATNDMWTVGEEPDGAKLERTIPALAHWNGTRWRKVSLPKLGQGSLAAVTVRSRRDVWAVGSQWTSDASRVRPLVLHWNGSSWRKISTAGLGRGALGQVALDGHGGFWAGQSTRLAHYTGGRWTTVRTPRSGVVNTLVSVPGTSTLWGSLIFYGSSSLIRYPR